MGKAGLAYRLGRRWPTRSSRTGRPGSTHLVQTGKSAKTFPFHSCTNQGQRSSSEYVSARVGCNEQARSKEGVRGRRGSRLTIRTGAGAGATQSQPFSDVARMLTSAAGDGRAGEDGPAARHRETNLLRRGQRDGGLIEESPRPSVFDLSVSARPGGSEAAGGREKTKTRKRGGGGGAQRMRASNGWSLPLEAAATRAAAAVVPASRAAGRRPQRSAVPTLHGVVMIAPSLSGQLAGLEALDSVGVTI